MSTSNAELQHWAQSASNWTRNSERIERFTAECTAALLDRLQPRPGQRLLDVAAGSGDPTLRLAQLVGPTGHVMATDGVSDMLAVLQQRAKERHLGNISVEVAAAEDLSLTPASFDGACSRFGVMFFADPQRALGAIRRAVKPGGPLVLAVWGAREQNPFFSMPFDTLEELGIPNPTPPDARTVFEYAEPGKLAALLRAAGWHEVREDTVRLHMPLAGVSPEGLLDVLCDISRRTSDRLAPLDAATRDRVRAGLARRAARYAQGDGLQLPAEVLLVSGRA